VAGEVVGAQEPALLASDGDEESAAGRSRLRLGEQTGRFEHHRDAHRVVVEAVVDRVAPLRRADPDGVEVGGEDDVLRRQVRVGSAPQADHVGLRQHLLEGAPAEREEPFRRVGRQAGAASEPRIVVVDRSVFGRPLAIVSSVSGSAEAAPEPQRAADRIR
jgi:hypothetical protein